MPSWYHRPLAVGDSGDDVLIVQRKVGAEMSGEYDENTAARVRGTQRKRGLKETGRVDRETAETLGERPTQGQVPEWFGRELSRDMDGEDVSALRRLIRQPNLPVHYDDSLEDAVRRYQAANGLDVTGVVDESTAISLGDLP